ncbi:MAG TPA: hypothetical protein VKJ00_15690 [Thermoanaerobaculia bacterium]|nr:hypothetical protein [Thermoanaerobaculia bacterium]
MQRSAAIPRLAVVLAAAGLLSPASGPAQIKPACAAGKTGKPAALTAREAWDLARDRARAWQPDAVPFEVTTTSLGPLDGQGRSTDWSLKFSSEKAKAVDMISITDGQITCYAVGGAGGRVIEKLDQVTFDSRALYDEAQKAGGSKVGAGAKVMAGLEQNRPGGDTDWYLNYQNAAGKEVLSVVIDARTGKVRNVFPAGK